MTCKDNGIVTFQKQNTSINTNCEEEASSELGCSECRWTFTATTPTLTWIIVHPLNCFPSVTTLNTDGERVHGGEKFINSSRIEIHFNEPMAGSANLN
jgi:hypothetical protein